MGGVVGGRFVLVFGSFCSLFLSFKYYAAIPNRFIFLDIDKRSL